MKKWMIISGAVLFAIFIVINFSIPKTLFLNRVTTIKAGINAVNRVVTEQKHTIAWWPKADNISTQDSGNSFMFKQYSFSFEKITDNNFIVLIIEKGDTLKGNIRITKLTTDTSNISWSCTLSTKQNLLTNIYYYWKAQKLSKIIDELLVHIKLYVENSRLLYGYTMNVENLTDNIVTVCKQICARAYLYKQLQMNFDTMNTYIAKNKLKITSDYMVNVQPLQNDSVSIMTGIPTSSFAAPEGNINYMQLPLGGHMVTVMYKGMYKKRDSAYHAIEQFISDKELNKASLPYEKLINNHVPTSDSSVVELKIYYPVF